MTTIRQDWTKQEVEALYQRPFADLLFEAQQVHRHYFDPNEIEIAKLLSIKTGRCPEDCAYCPQSGHFNTGLEKEPLLEVEAVLAAARAAKASGATRFCMGAAWRSPPKKAMPALKSIIEGVNALGLESCMTLGMLSDEQVDALDEAGLHYYNHNLDTSESYYEKIISTRQYQDRLNTLSRVRKSNIKTCCGGIMGMGESESDRIDFLHQLATLPSHPESVPINQLIPIEGTPLAETKTIPPIEFIRTIACARILMPKSVVRLSAGRESMSDEMQSLCFLAGANSIFYGDTLLTADNPSTDQDQALFNLLGIRPKQQNAAHETRTG